ncbi:DUF397 domain-containing protein [Streptomyces sp. NPDC006798]|uniref:DUF397 domain-containing protein n=1 Tax=Streptomyces sp. NPDC006798 TaxID=3155462 RepID=UPI003406C850
MRATDLVWLKSSYSKSGGHGNCVEVAMDWHKSSYSGGSGDDCVEVATCPATIHVRDSKNPGGGWLDLSARAWGGFLTYATGRP